MRLLRFLFKYRLIIFLLTFFMIVRGYSSAVLDENATFRYAFTALDHTALLVAAYFGCLMWGTYLLNKVTDLEEDQRNVPAEALSRASSARVFVVALLLMFLPSLGVAISSSQHLGLYLAVALLGVWYSCRLPLFSRRIRLKDVIVVKNVVTAATWAAVIVAVPALSRTVAAVDVMSFFELFSLLMILVLISDVRDIEGDLLVGARTIPSVWGVQATKVICGVLWVVVAVLGGLHRRPLGLIFLLVVVALLVAILMVSADRKPSFYYAVGSIVCFDLVAAV